MSLLKTPTEPVRKAKIKSVEVLNKQTKAVETIPIKDFVNPKSSTAVETGLKPKTYHAATEMLIGMLRGEIHQNTSFAVRLEGVEHIFDWD